MEDKKVIKLDNQKQHKLEVNGKIYTINDRQLIGILAGLGLAKEIDNNENNIQK